MVFVDTEVTLVTNPEELAVTPIPRNVVSELIADVKALAIAGRVSLL